MRSRFVVLVVSALVFGACDSGDDDSAEPTTSTAAGDPPFPVTVEAANGPVEIEQPPLRIVSLSPTATEMLYAIGAGEHIVAADSLSNYPAEAPDTDLSATNPDPIAIASYSPDLVVMADDSIADRLASVNIDVLVEPAAKDLDDTYDQFHDLGSATGRTERARAVTAEMQADIDELVDDIETAGARPTYYHELDPTLYSATSKTFIGELFALAGLDSIADTAPDSAGAGYPKLTNDFVVDHNPDYIFLADVKCCHQSATTVAARPGWFGVQAVQAGRVTQLDDDVASRWGPRVVNLLRAIIDATEEHP